MFGDPVRKNNRRLTPKELETDIELAKLFKRPVRTFIDDKPFYPWLVPAPKVPFPNFQLNFKE